MHHRGKPNNFFIRLDWEENFFGRLGQKIFKTKKRANCTSTVLCSIDFHPFTLSARQGQFPSRTKSGSCFAKQGFKRSRVDEPLMMVRRCWEFQAPGSDLPYKLILIFSHNMVRYPRSIGQLIIPFCLTELAIVRMDSTEAGMAGVGRCPSRRIFLVMLKLNLGNHLNRIREVKLILGRNFPGRTINLDWQQPSSGWPAGW